MNNFETIPPKKNKPESSSKEILSQKGLTRRGVLKGLTAAATIATVGPKIVELAENIDNAIVLSSEEQGRLDAAIAKVSDRLEPAKTQKEIDSLIDIAKIHHINIDILKKLNPTIRNTKISISKQAQIRIPKKS